MKAYLVSAFALIASTVETAELKGGMVRLALLVAFLAIGWGLVWIFARLRQANELRDHLIAKRMIERAERREMDGFDKQIGTKNLNRWE